MPQLDYAPPSGRRRRLMRRLGLAAIVLGGIVLSLPLLKFAVEHFRIVRLYDRCGGIQLMERAYREEWMQGSQRPFTVGDSASLWHDLNAGLSSNILSSGTIFVGKLHTPDGTRERLVGIDVVRTTQSPMVIYTHARTVISGGMLSLPRYGPASDQTIPLPPGEPLLVLHAGVIDRSDSSHFVIKYDAGGQHGTIDGWLKDDESVVLEPHADSATTAPAPLLPGKSP